MDEYRCETRTTPLTRNDDDIWYICRYRVQIYNNGGQIVITVELLRCWTFDPGEGGEEEASLTLDCGGGSDDNPPLRGSQVNCAASLEGGNEDASGAVFEWESNDTTWSDSSDTGESTWGGVATNTTDITVTVITGEEVKDTMSETVTVSVEARTWTLSGLTTTPQHVDILPLGVRLNRGDWGSGEWGFHVWQATDPVAVSGSGPWENRYMTDAKPRFLNAIFLHSDLVASGAAHPDANLISHPDTACAATTTLVGECMDRSSANVWTVNDRCGSGGSLGMWNDSVRVHEEKHETSLNACIASTTAATAMEAIEALVGTEEEVETGLSTHWKGDRATDLYTKLQQAAETPYQEPDSPLIWEYRYKGAWRKHVLILGGHTGTVGC